MRLRRSARLRARAFPLTELSSDLQRHVASFLGPTDLMSLSGSSRGLMTSLADRRAHVQEPWTAVRPLVQEIERAAKLAGDLVRRLPASEREAMQMATARGLTFGDAGWFRVPEHGSRFSIKFKRTVTCRDGAKLTLKVAVSLYDPVYENTPAGHAGLTGSIQYEKANTMYNVNWGIPFHRRHDRLINVEDDRYMAPRTSAWQQPIGTLLLKNVMRALRTSGLKVELFAREA